MSTTAQIWLVAAVAVGALTAWGNVEYWRARRRPEPSAAAELSGFSDTIDDCGSGPLIDPEALDLRRDG